MKRQYTLEDLRKLGVETVSKAAVIGRGKNRRQFIAGPNGVVFDFDRMKPDEQLRTGALIAALEKKAAGEPVTEGEFEDAQDTQPAQPAKKTSAKKAAPKQAE